MTTLEHRPAPAGVRLLDLAADARSDAGHAGHAGRAAWSDLADVAAHANPFQRPELLLPALRHLDPAADDEADRVRLLALPDPARGPGSLGLLLPVAPRSRWRRVPWPAQTGWQHTHHFLGTPLVSPTFGVEGWRSALDLLAAGDGAPWLVLPLVDVDVAREVEVAAARDRRTTRRLETTSRPVTHRRPHDDYLEQRLSGSRRKELRRVRRRLEEQAGGDLRLVDLVAEGRLEEGIEAFLRLEAAGWKGADGGAIAKNPAERAWFEESCRALAARPGALELLSLEGGTGRPVAMAVDLRDGDTLFTAKIAYDEAHAAHSPGLVLYLDQLHRFHESDAAVLDTCAYDGHPMASRLHGDRRDLVTLAVALRRRPGNAAVASAPGVLHGVAAARDLAHGVRRRVAERSTASTAGATGTDRPTPTAPPHTPPQGEER